MKILVVDDKEEERYLSETLLKESGYEVETAANGAEALEKLRAEGFDMIITDILMPVMDGFQLCRECKGDEKLRDIPLVFHTAEYAEKEDEKLALDLGVDKFIRKPIEPDEFIKLIQGVFRDVEEGKKKPAVAGMRILVAEDNEDSRNLLVKQLRAYGHEVTAAANGAEALEQALAEPPDIIVSDILMPKMDGFRLGQECKQNEQLKNIPLVFYSATYLKDEDKKFALSIGAETFITKPSAPDVIAQKLCEAYEKAKSGALTATKVTPLEASAFTTEHAQRVAAKLEEKVAQLEAEITEHNRAEKALRESEERFRDLLENANDLIQSVTPDGHFVYVNRMWREVLGYSNEEIANLTLWDIIHPDFIPHCREAFQKVISGETVNDIEAVFMAKDRKLITVEGTASCRFEGGKPVATRSIFRDITERRRVQEELQIAEQNFRNSLESSPLGIRIITEEGETIYANQAILDIYGYSSVEELKATPVKKRYTPESYAEHQERVQRRKLGKPVPSSYEVSIVRKDGEIRQLVVSRKAVVWGGEVQFQLVYQDITERKRMEKELKESEEKLSTILENTKDVIFQLSPLGKIVYVSPTSIELYGYKPRDLIGKHLKKTTPISELPKALKALKSVLSGETISNLEINQLDANGNIIPVEINVTPVRKDGKIIALQGVMRDIIQRKEAQDRIKRAAEEWRTTFDSITDLVFIADKDYKLVRVNKAFADVVKKKPEELIGKLCYETVHGTNEPVLNCPHKKTIKTKKSATAEFFEPHLGIYIEVATSPIFDGKGEVVASVHVARDVSERKKMEEQLIVTDRLASIGELSSGIAHELNNPLTGVIGLSDLLLQRDLPDDIKEDLKVINREAQRTAGIVRNLLTFARKHPPAKEPTNMNSIIEKVLELRAYEQKVSNIEVNTRFAPDLPEITADSFQLQQVFLNIIINAEHFMTEARGRGTFTITTERVGDIIRASFADDGPGIAKENMGHLFDQFFTTKEVGKGTGLGLSICHGIITEHGGKIYAKSELGKGATFVVELPVSK